MSKLTLNIEADSIEDMASKLADLHSRFSSIAQQTRAPQAAGEKVAVADAPPPAPPPPPAPATSGKTAEPAAPPATTKKEPKQPKEPKAPKAAADKAPRDRFFEEDGTAAAAAPVTPPAQVPAEPKQTDIEDAIVEQAYTHDMQTQDAFQQLRAKAKLFHDTRPAGQGQDALRAAWSDCWPHVMGDALNDTNKVPGLKHIENNRDAILRALAVFDKLNGIDPFTGEELAGDPAEELL